jgi:hypothetical protein
MITINLNISAVFANDAMADYKDHDDFIDAVCAHVTSALDLVDVNVIVYNEVSVEGNEGFNGFN